MNFRDVTASLNQIPIQQAGQWVGISALPRFGSLRCPFPDHLDKSPSFVIRRCGLRWKCYACDRSGGTIDFVRFYRQIDFREAKQWLFDRAENPRTAAAVRRVGVRPLPEATLVPASDKTDTEVYEAFLASCPLEAAGRAYLHLRAFTDATIDHFRVGQVPAGDLGRQLATTFGFRRLMASGLLSARSTPDNLRLAFRSGYLVFPILEAGKVVSLQARQTGTASGGPKYVYLTGKRPRTYNLDVLSTSARQIAICEGIPDTMSAHQLGFSAIGLLGVSNALHLDEISRLKGKRVIFLLDWDENGEKKSQSLRSELTAHGIVCLRKSKPSPDVKDLNEYLMLGRDNVAS